MARRSGETWRGVVILMVVTMIWGTTFVVVKEALVGFPASVLVAMRFVLATLLVMPWWGHIRRSLWRPSVELGFWLTLCYGAQAIGLEYIAPGRSAFIAATFVVMVPLVKWLRGESVTRRQHVAVVIAFAGVALLSFDGSRPGVGDMITLVSAVGYAGYMFALERHGAAHDDRALTLAQLLGVSAWAVVWSVCDMVLAGEMTWSWQDIPWKHILYLSVCATALTTWMQTVAQRILGATRTAVLYMLEPLWATLFAFLIVGERPGWRGWMGGAWILVATMMVESDGEEEPPPSH